MSDYIIQSTDHSKSVAIKAGTKNGDFVGVIENDTDLLLFGRGTFDWGSGIEQNLFRLTENWACEAENPNVPDLVQRPKVFNTLNKGIKKPLIGQHWFNKSNLRTYVCVGYAAAGQYAGLNAGDALWRIDGEGRYLPLAGGEMNGLLRLTRPTGTPVSLEMRSKDEDADVDLKMYDASGLKLQLILDNQTGVDNVRLRKRNNSTIINEIILRDNYVEVAGNGNNGKIRTQPTAGNDNENTLTTKGYVDGQIDVNKFDGGTISGDINIVRSTGTPVVRIRAFNQSSDPTIRLADQGGDKFAITLNQRNSTEDSVELYKRFSTGVIINGFEIFDDYISLHPDNGALYHSLDPFNIDQTISGQPGVGRRLLNVATAKQEFLRLGGGTMSGNLNIERNVPFVRVSGTDPRFVLNATNETPADIFFDADGSTRAQIGLAQNFPAGIEDTLILRKRVGTSIKNEVRIRDNVTEFLKSISFNPDSGSDSEIRFQSNNTGVDRAGTIISNPTSHDLVLRSNFANTGNAVGNQLTVAPTITAMSKKLRVESASSDVLRLKGTNTSADVNIIFDSDNRQRGVIGLDKSEGEMEISVYATDGTTRLNWLEIEPDRSIFNKRVESSATIDFDSSNNSLTTKSYVDLRARYRSSTFSMPSRSFRRNVANSGIWYDTSDNTGGSIVAAEDLHETIVLPSEEELYHIRSSNTASTASIKVSFSFAFAAFYSGPVTNTFAYGNFKSFARKNNGSWTQLHNVVYPFYGYHPRSGGMIRSDISLLSVTPGDTVDFRFDYDQFGPVHDSSSNTSIQQLLDDYDSISVTDVEWSWET